MVSETVTVCAWPTEGVIVTVAVYVCPNCICEPVPSAENVSLASLLPCPEGETLNHPVG